MNAQAARLLLLKVILWATYAHATQLVQQMETGWGTGEAGFRVDHFAVET